jgi:hypothetical protein
MKQQNFVTAAMQPVQRQPLNTVQPKRTFNLFSAISELYTQYTEWTARRNRVKICRTVAKAFRTDMESAGTLLFLFRDKTLWIDGDPYEERTRLFAYLSGETEQPQIEQREAPVHPAWPKEVLAQRAPMIEYYDEFEPEPHSVTKLAQVLSMAQVDRPKVKQSAKAKMDATTLAAMDVLTEFALKLYDSLETDEPLVKQDGTLVKGTIAPWAQRGVDTKGNKVSDNIKRRMDELISDTDLFVLTESKLWRLDLFAYPDFDTACAAVEDAAKS